MSIAIYGLLQGLVFGVALEKSKVYVPELIRQQMLFTKFTMLKVFLVGTIVGMVAIALMEHFKISKRKVKPCQALGLGIFGGMGANIFGGTLLGIGMTLTGACPGTVLAQIGAGVPNALIVYVGGIVGAFIFGYLQKSLKKSSGDGFMKTGSNSTVDSAMGAQHLNVTLIASIILGFVVTLVEYYNSWRGDLSSILAEDMSRLEQQPDITLSLSAPAWNPIVAGVVIGLLQIPAFLAIKSAIGTSTSYVTIAGYISNLVDPNSALSAPYLNKYMGSAGNIWQVVMVFGVTIGAYISSTLGAVNIVHQDGLGDTSPITAFFGGMVLVVGSRIAGGCTSGHGISGMAQLGIASIVTTMFMFVGGIGSAVFFYAGQA
jgi:uncharacterized membrane protein YedE/YeeE